MTGVRFATDTIDTQSYRVYLGAWINWSRGPVFGATLTLNRKTGTLLIAFTAFFVTIVASRFWRIICSILHRKLSTTDYRDVLHHQCQAVFRNSSSSGSGLWLFIQISWAWRHLARKNPSRTLPYIIFASVCLLAFSLASVFSSSISTAVGDEVLIDGTNCGFVDRDLLTAKERIQILGPWEAGVVSNAISYAQQVYSPDRTGVLANSAFVRKTLNTISNSEAPCPFKGNICRSNTSNLLLDTGKINICKDLGLNLPKDQCFILRNVAHCAPLETAGRSELTEYEGYSNYTGYKYGPFMDPTTNELDASNYTTIIEDVYSQYKLSARGANDIGYGLVSVDSRTQNGSAAYGDFYPDPDLQRPDADISIYFLFGNGVVTSAPVDDPWYRSNVPATNTIYWKRLNSTYQPQETFQPAEAASPLGCATQSQICKGPSGLSSTCGSLTSYIDAFSGASTSLGIDLDVFQNANTSKQIAELYASDEEASRYLWMLMALASYPKRMVETTDLLGSQSLASRRSLAYGIQGPLPNDQWKVDVSNWWNISLAALQASMVDAASGISDPAMVRFKFNATNPGQKTICRNQKILSNSYTNMSLFGLYFTYIVGTIIIVASYVLDPILSFAQKRWKNREYENLEWACNETLQLQRLAYEESGQGDWSKCTDSIPVTAAHQELAPLDISDPEHPLLRPPTSLRPRKDSSECSDVSPEDPVTSSDDEEGTMSGRNEEHRYQHVASGRSLTDVEELPLGHMDHYLGDEYTCFTPTPISTTQRHSVPYDPDHGRDQARLRP
ncbi:hypothetical protein NPX13_g3357 [Xylaria arbuscula]|uniref:Uncharacterized protein n=1 Tax=Xylaria arbuscula TaxID=114810 RepID=A0A9W8TNB1_9PEZI|nr:hypothetical protein NPX13_g3357 [Xylaria arbuscula]